MQFDGELMMIKGEVLASMKDKSYKVEVILNKMYIFKFFSLGNINLHKTTSCIHLDFNHIYIKAEKGLHR